MLSWRTPKESCPNFNSSPSIITTCRCSKKVEVTEASNITDGAAEISLCHKQIELAARGDESSPSDQLERVTSIFRITQICVASLGQGLSAWATKLYRHQSERERERERERSSFELLQSSRLTIESPYFEQATLILERHGGHS